MRDVYGCPTCRILRGCRKFGTVQNLLMAQTNCKRCGREYIYHCCDGPVFMPCPHCGFDESDPDPPTVSDQPVRSD